MQSVLRQLESGTIFKEGAEKGIRAWKEANSEKLKEVQRLTRLVSKKREAHNRYLRAFEEGTKPEARCSERVKEIGNEIEGLEARKATLEAEEGPPPTLRRFL
jgi:hypothetical protein